MIIQEHRFFIVGMSGTLRDESGAILTHNLLPKNCKDPLSTLVPAAEEFLLKRGLVGEIIVDSR